MDGSSLSPDDDVTPRAWAGLAVVSAASFVATLGAMVLYVAFGDIRRDFPEVDAAALSWIRCSECHTNRRTGATMIASRKAELFDALPAPVA